MPPLPMTTRTPNLRITSPWYGSSRALVVGPAAIIFQPSPSFSTTGPQW